MPNDRLHRISALQLFVDRFGYPTLGSSNPDLQLALRAAMAFVSPVRVNLNGCDLGDPLSLLQAHFERVPVMGVARQGLGSHDETFFVG